jgi:hypothetical protein
MTDLDRVHLPRRGGHGLSRLAILALGAFIGSAIIGNIYGRVSSPSPLAQFATLGMLGDSATVAFQNVSAGTALPVLDEYVAALGHCRGNPKSTFPCHGVVFVRAQMMLGEVRAETGKGEEASAALRAARNECASLGNWDCSDTGLKRTLGGMVRPASPH